MDKACTSFETLRQFCAMALGGEKRPVAVAADFTAHGLALAGRHCVVPLLAAGVAAAGDDATLPADWRSALRRKSLVLSRQLVQMETELSRIATCLSAARVEFLLLKGPAVARQAYPVPDWRGYDDLDLWVSSRDFEAAVHALSAAGYRRRLSLDARAAACARRAGIGMAFDHPERGQLIEVAHGERSLAPTSRAAREIIEGATSVVIAGTPVRVPKPVHALLFACRHGAHHRWDRLAWVADVAGLWRRLSSAEHEEACTLARRWREEMMLGLGLRLAAESLGLALEDRAAELAARPPVPELARRVGLEKIGHDSPRVSPLECLAFERVAHDTAGQTGRLMADWIFTPTLGDIAAVPLPGALYPLYALVRPLRLLRHPWLRDWRKLAGRRNPD